MCRVIKGLYEKHDYLLQSDCLKERDKVTYESILALEATDINVKHSLNDLIKYLYAYHRSKVVVLIDEYDTPIQSGYLQGYYEQAIQFFRNFFGAALKDNKYVFKAVLTGILRVAKENLFSGLNNLVTYSVLNDGYGDYFGFTESEVENLLKSAELGDHLVEVKSWYNGYCIGGKTIYNPWSIANYLKQLELQAYWINTSDNALIRRLVLKSSLRFKEQLELLLQDKSLEKIIDPNIVFADLDLSEAAIWSLLLMSGYLKSVDSEITPQGIVCQLKIPNQEVRSLYRQIIEQWLSDRKGVDWYNEFLNALLLGGIRTLKDYLGDILLQVISYHDVARHPEAFYQGLMIGLTASLDKAKYILSANKESGHGRYDIVIMPTDLQQLAIVIELKSIKSVDETGLMVLLEKTAKEALIQVDSKAYDSGLRQRGFKRWLKIGLAFSGKFFYLAEKYHESD